MADSAAPPRYDPLADVWASILLAMALARGLEPNVAADGLKQWREEMERPRQ